MRKLLLLLLVSFSVHAQNYPNRPIRVIVPFPPGDAADILARLIGPKVSERLGQQMVVENRPGASGQIGMALLKDAPADGYTIGVGQGGNMVVAPHTYKKLQYDPLKDFTPLALIATNYLAVIANANVPFNNAKEMVAWAKANPGKLSLATNGEGGFPHLAFEHFAAMAGFKFQHVPYKGASQIAGDVIGGQVQLGIGAYTSMSPHVNSGRAKLIGVTNDVKVPNKPERPLLADAAPGYDSRGWFGYVTPAGTPKEIVNLLNAEINRAMRQPDVAQKMTNAGLIITTESPEFFAQLLKTDYEKYGKLVKSIGFQPQ